MSAAMTDTEKTSPAKISLSAEEEKLNTTEGAQEEHIGIDLRERDPNGWNDHLEVRFGDIFAEPDKEIHSFDKVWVLSHKTYTLTKVWCYRISSLICGIPLSVLWGLYFACLSFCTIWCCMPCIKSEQIELLCLKKIWVIYLNTFVEPCFKAVGAVFSGCRFRVQKDADTVLGV